MAGGGGVDCITTGGMGNVVVKLGNVAGLFPPLFGGLAGPLPDATIGGTVKSTDPSAGGGKTGVKAGK